MSTKLERMRERLGVKFDVNELKTANSVVTRKTVAAALGISGPSIDNYQKGLWPLSCFKAVIEKFAPQLSHAYELKVLVEETSGSFFVSPEAIRLARLYDVRNGGHKITLASGKGYHIIPDGLTPFEEAMVAETVAKPTLTLLPDAVEEEGLAPVREPEESRERMLLDQQDALIQLLARAVSERNAFSLEKEQLRLKVHEQEGIIKAQAERNRILKQSVKEWEELVGKTDHLAGADKFSGDAVADAVISRLVGILEPKRGTGRPDLRLELTKLSPKPAGYRQ